MARLYLRYEGPVKLCECGCGQPAPIAKGKNPKYGWLLSYPKRFRHGHARGLHGMLGTPTYNSYKGAKQRCTNPKSTAWDNYGGRGIEFRFTSFKHFLAELGVRPEGKTLDRIDVNGHYEPGNVRWSTPGEQRENQRPRECDWNRNDWLLEDDIPF
jgi:hypothetical protein